ncbi:MAG: MBL fold metallo-hydrolase [Thermoplasmata archaeon]|nr:MBL fold metallo-hydrolase [Thermoplasmata archaeon]
MAEVLPGVHQVEGVDPSPDFSTHVYLVKDPGGSWTLIDTGLPGSEAAIEAYAKKHGISMRSIAKILITHLHRDHTGSLRKMIEKTHARTFSHWVEAGFIAERPAYVGPGVAPSEAVEIDERLKDGDRVDAAGGLIAYHTPGHTPGHTSFYQPERKILFSGDLFFGNGAQMSLTPPEYTLHMGTAQISARRMAELDALAVMSYHGGPFLTGGSKRMRELVATF